MNIQWEIIKNGSVTASFVVHEDFLEYKNGIYQVITLNNYQFIKHHLIAN